MGRKKCHQKIIREQLESIEDCPIDLKDIMPDKAEVKEITYEEAKKVILKYEWLGTMPSGAFLSVGLFINNYLAGVEVFTNVMAGGKYTLLNEECTLLARGCCVHWCPKWGSSFLIKRALKILEDYYQGKPRYVIAFSDWEAGEIGTVYQASNWVYLGCQPYYHWLSPDGIKYDKSRHRQIAKMQDKNYYKINGCVNIELANKIKENMISNGWIYRFPIIRGRYATVIGFNGKEKKRLQNKLINKQKPYPKEHKQELNTDDIGRF